MIDRREFLRLSAAFSLCPVAGRAGMPQFLGVYRHGVGDFVVTALLDGYFEFQFDKLIGIEQAEIAPLLAAVFLADRPVPTSINAFLVQTGTHTVLIDSGNGPVSPTLGNLPACLDAAGVTPEEIDTVIFTHLHSDHIGGAVADGRAVFANADVHAHADDITFWTDKTNFVHANQMNREFAEIAQSTLTIYGDRVHAVTTDRELLPGITTHHMPGHTPGHMGLMLESKGERLLIWADTLHLGPVQLARPEVAVTYDIDPALGATTRTRVLAMAAAERLEVAGNHLDFPSFGHVMADGAGYRFQPSRYDHDP